MSGLDLHREDTPPLSTSPRVQAARDRIHDALAAMTVERLEVTADVVEALLRSSHLAHDQVTRASATIADHHARRRGLT